MARESTLLMHFDTGLIDFGLTRVLEMIFEAIISIEKAK
jgi:hypothetical protein